MSARDFIEAELLPWIEATLAEEAAGSKHFLAGFDSALKGVRYFIEQHRRQWDVED